MVDEELIKIQSLITSEIRYLEILRHQLETEMRELQLKLYGEVAEHEQISDTELFQLYVETAQMLMRQLESGEYLTLRQRSEELLQDVRELQEVILGHTRSVRDLHQRLECITQENQT